MSTTAERGSVSRSRSRVAIKAVRHLRDRFLHPRRHRRVIQRLVSSPPPRTILVVCHGNVCRSPYMQAALQRLLPHSKVLSAGFLAGGRRIPQTSLTVSARRGFDLSGFRSSALSAVMIKQADLVIVMHPNQASGILSRFRLDSSRVVVAGDLDPRFDETRAVRDPWNGSESVFEAAFDRLDRCVETLVAAITRDGSHEVCCKASTEFIG